MYRCWSCQKELDIEARNIGRGSQCDFCDADLKVCLACSFYDENSYNECHESMAERVVEKKRANFCEYFKAATDLAENKKGPTDNDIAKRWDQLFKK